MRSVLLAFNLLLISPFSYSFTLNSGSQSSLEGWSDSEITLNVNTANCPAGVDVPGLINDAAAIWNGTPTSKVKVSYGTTTTSTTFSAPTTVYCETNFQTVTGADQNYVPAAASVQAPGGRISQGLFYINASAGQANIANYDRSKLVIIVAHEIGHILGLGHSENTNALMYYSGSDKINLALSQDDIDGITYLYPKDELKGQQMLGCGVVSAIITRRPPGGFFGLMLCLLLPIFVYFILRRRQAA